MQLTDFGMDTITLAGPLEAKLRAIRRSGFTQVMLSAQEIVGHPRGAEAAVAAVRASGLRVAGLRVLRDFEGLAGHPHDYKTDVAKSMLRLCRALGADILLTCSSVLSQASGDEDALVADLRKLAMLAVPLGVRIGYKALSWGLHVSEYPQAWRIVERADRANLGLIVDSFHLLATRTSLDALEDIDPRKIFFVQLSDFLWRDAPTPAERIDTARHLRVFPGEGVHGEAIAQLVGRLDALGYWGGWNFEVYNDDYLQMPVDEVVARAHGSVGWVVGHVPRRNLPVRRPHGRPGSNPATAPGASRPPLGDDPLG